MAATGPPVQALRDELRVAEQAQRSSERRTEQLKDDLSDLIREAAVVRGRLADLSGERADLRKRESSRPSRPKHPPWPQRWSTPWPKLRPQPPAKPRRATSSQPSILQCAMQLAAKSRRARRWTIRQRASRAPVTNWPSPAPAPQRIMPHAASEKLSLVLKSLNGDRPLVTPALLLDAVKATSRARTGSACGARRNPRRRDCALGGICPACGRDPQATRRWPIELHPGSDRPGRNARSD